MIKDKRKKKKVNDPSDKNNTNKKNASVPQDKDKTKKKKQYNQGMEMEE